FQQAALELHQRSSVFEVSLIDQCRPDLEQWDANVRPGTVVGAGATIGKLANLPEAQRADSPKQVVERIQADVREFKARHKLDQVVVANVASTEPPVTPDERYASADKFRAALETKGGPIPASALYAWAAVDLGLPYINFTPSLGAS